MPRFRNGVRRLGTRGARENLAADGVAPGLALPVTENDAWRADVERARRSIAEGKGRTFADVEAELLARARDIARNA